MNFSWFLYKWCFILRNLLMLVVMTLTILSWPKKIDQSQSGGYHEAP